MKERDFRSEIQLGLALHEAAARSPYADEIERRTWRDDKASLFQVPLSFVSSEAARRDAVEAFTNSSGRQLPFYECYAYPALYDAKGGLIHVSGADGFQNILDYADRGGTYHVNRTDIRSIRQNPVSLEGVHLISFGPAKGTKEYMMCQEGGLPQRITLIDISTEYLAAAKALLMTLGMREESIVCIHANYFDPKFYPEIWDRYIQDDGGLQKIVVAYGCEWGNDHQLGRNLTELRPRLAQSVSANNKKSFIRAGIDSTGAGPDGDISTLGIAYSDHTWEPWIVNSANFVLSARLDLSGFNPYKHAYFGDITVDNRRQTTVHFQLRHLAEQELCRRNLNPDSPALQEFVRLMPGASLILASPGITEIGISEKITHDYVREIAAAKGSETEGPLPYDKGPEARAINNNLWDFVPG